ncbi:MAG: phosphodiester glycosidase family protein [Bacteroidales bacterium]|jgi:exopolysaccharide biosynthesis protein|nr:phosphodiester glycosidase family protein [Bacteroidales bacterium]
MVKRYLKPVATLLFFVAFCGQGFSQSSDSTTFVNGPWNKSEVSKGIIHKKIHISKGDLFASNQFISIVEIKPESGAKIEIFASPVLKQTSLMAAESGAKVALNGSFFKFNNSYNTEDYNSVDYIRKENKQLAPNTWPALGRSMHQLGALAIFRGELFILKADALREWEKYIQAEEVLTTGPILRVAGEDLKLANASFYTTRHPRTAVGKRSDGTILLITADGRSPQAAGLSLAELQKIMKWLGADYAINLDGGGSTTLYIEGASDNGVVNHPTDNKTFDNKGERKVANAILVHTK